MKFSTSAILFTLYSLANGDQYAKFFENDYSALEATEGIFVPLDHMAEFEAKMIQEDPEEVDFVEVDENGIATPYVLLGNIDSNSTSLSEDPESGGVDPHERELRGAGYGRHHRGYYRQRNKPAGVGLQELHPGLYQLMWCFRPRHDFGLPKPPKLDGAIYRKMLIDDRFVPIPEEDVLGSSAAGGNGRRLEDLKLRRCFKFGPHKMCCQNKKKTIFSKNGQVDGIIGLNEAVNVVEATKKRRGHRKHVLEDAVMRGGAGGMYDGMGPGGYRE
eukprot:CAMPEP_0116034668 /NCGR_PEP_ID=MMETSP0321-20121206/19769_1 /TAXON_ID=163516 /ORGANISM="Leptocylindrus danicus var. danicus, Strain B650" /LENGTH=272 /DNA_ID=CAMNT_0003511073 /DNA_START=174 /DNA_END=992 /DNA_ORIENTATION=+